MSLTLFDYLVFAIMIFFMFLGLLRGFIRELSSLANWIGSGLLTVLLRPIVNDLISSKISNSVASNVVSSIIIFVIAIIGLSILTSNIARAINTKFPSSINITLGLAFGFTKGFLICSLIFATILNLFGDTDDLSSKSGPKWLQASQTYRPLSFGAYIILPFADSILGQIKEKYLIPESNDKEENDSKTNDSNDKFDSLRRYKNDYDEINNLLDKADKLRSPKQSEQSSTDQQKENTQKDSGGYKKDQMNKLNHLIDIL